MMCRCVGFISRIANIIQRKLTSTLVGIKGKSLISEICIFLTFDSFLICFGLLHIHFTQSKSDNSMLICQRILNLVSFYTKCVS